METTSQMPMRYYPAPDDDYNDKEGSGHNAVGCFHIINELN